MNDFLCNKRTVSLDPVSSEMNKKMKLMLGKYTDSVNITGKNVNDCALMQETILNVSQEIRNCHLLQNINICGNLKSTPINFDNLFEYLGQIMSMKSIIISMPMECSADKIIKTINLNKSLHTLELPFYIINEADRTLFVDALTNAECLEIVSFNFEMMTDSTLKDILREFEDHASIKEISSPIPWRGQSSSNLIRYSTKLESITLNLNYIPDTKLSGSESISNSIKNLVINQMKTQDLGIFIDSLFPNTTIETLSLGVVRDTKIYEKIGKLLQKNKNIKFLKLHGASPIQFTSENTPLQDSIIHALEANTTLISLKSQGGGINISTIINSMKRNQILQRLKLKDVRFLGKEGLTMTQMIRGCFNLKSLSIILPDLSSEVQNVLQLLQTFFDKSAKFTEIIYVRGIIGKQEENPSSILSTSYDSIIGDNKNLKKVSIRNIPIPPLVINNLMLGLMKNTYIEVVELENIGLNDENANYIAELLLTNSTLTEMSFSQNTNLGLQGIIAILSALRINKKLLLMNLTGASISHEDRKIISAKAKSLIIPTKLLI